MHFFVPCVYRFLQFLRVVKNASEHTVRNYCLDLEDFKAFFEEKFPPEKRSQKIDHRRTEGEEGLFAIEAVDKRFLRAYLARLAEEGGAKKTILRKVSTLRSFYKFLVKQKLIEHNPLDAVDSPKADKRLPVSLSYEQVERFLSQADLSSYLGLRDRAIMELFYSSALRISELVGLDRADFDQKNWMLRILGKGKKQRNTPITRSAADWLVRYLEDPRRLLDEREHSAQIDTQAIFLNKWGKRLSARSIDRGFQGYLRASGLSGRITPHTMRHTIATHWLEKGMDLKTIQTLLGHSSLATTTIYTQVSSRLKREVYDKAHPLEVLSEKNRESDKPDPVVEQSFF